ncbi:Ubiquinol-cytochrome C reductase iron-sulfur subunit [hydrothermal vent metagenome]|uniref:Ubiquinol-cytochrome c reductase iron-sulfur subunit n=1 Tax=hydrothermal vent metagenome TaxID=652676 RepID=A0A3B1ABS8_9ZZZZ
MSQGIVNITSDQKQRRRFLINATVILGAVGTGGLLVPFVKSMSPSDRARTAGAPIQVDISRLQMGEQLTILWRRKPVWVLRRDDAVFTRLQDEKLRDRLRDPDSAVESQQPVYAQNEFRSINSEYLVVVALCTHLGCVPNYRPELAPDDLGDDWPGGYFCPCHGSMFDLAGRVYKGVPAPTNLVIPPYQYLTDSLIEIGTSKAV